MELSTGLVLPPSASATSLGREFFAAVHRLAPELFPTHYDQTEPIRRTFSYDNLDAIVDSVWSNGFLWKNSTSGTMAIWSTSTIAKIKRHCTLFVYGRIKSLNVDHYRTLYRELSRIVDVDFGYIHARTQGERDHLLKTANEAFQPFNSGVVTHDLRRWIPNLAWATLFGKPYIELIGRERLLSAPAHTVDEWSDSIVYMQLSDDITEMESDYKEIESTRLRIKAHLGEQFFYSPGATPNEKEAPAFDFS